MEAETHLARQIRPAGIERPRSVLYLAYARLPYAVLRLRPVPTHLSWRRMAQSHSTIAAGHIVSVGETGRGRPPHGSTASHTSSEPGSPAPSSSSSPAWAIPSPTSRSSIRTP